MTTPSATQEQLNHLIPQLNRATVEFDVSSISIDRATGNHVLRVTLKGNRGSSTIDSLSVLFEPIGYPLLFPHGEIGWGRQHKDGHNPDGSPCFKISFLDYLASRMLMPELSIRTVPTDPRHRLLEDGEIISDPELRQLLPDGYGPDSDPDWETELAQGRFGKVCVQLDTNRPFFYPASRFDRFSRLGQVYLVDQMSRAIDFRMDNLRRLQDHIFGGRLREPAIDDDSSDEDEAYDNVGDDQGHHGQQQRQPLQPNSRPTFLGDTCVGSKRHLKKQAINALHVVSQEGSSHAFITLTTNKTWPEFEEVRWPDTDVFDMPAVVAEVFHARLQAFLHNLREGKYFGGGKPVFIVRVIEYQERGLPHAHIVIRLDDAPRKIDDYFQNLNREYEEMSDAEREGLEAPTIDDAAALWVDDNISAELPFDPRLPANQDRYAHLGAQFMDSQEFNDDLTLFLHVQQFHIHTHSGPNLVNGCLDKNGQCKKGFMKNVVREKTTFSKEGFPLYRRRKVEDLNIVPYNRQITLDWGGHCNVEFSGLTYTVLYLYKYLFKGPSKVHLLLTPPPTRPGILPLHPQDEIGRYVRGRRLCSMDAMWRLLGFENYPKSDPAVIGVKVRDPLFVTHYDDKQLLTQIQVYFNRPDNRDGIAFNSMLFAEMFQQFRVVREKPPATFTRRKYEITQFHNLYGTKPVWIVERDPRRRVLCRLHTVAYSSGDLWYARLLLKNFPFRSFNHMKSFEESNFDTFQEAAIAREIAGDVLECKECFISAALDDGRSPRQLRGLFVTLAINAFPVLVIYNDDVLRNRMLDESWIDDPRHDDPTTDRRLATEMLLSDLRDRFAEHGKTNTDYGLPEPAQAVTEMQRYELRFGNVPEQRRLYVQLRDSKRLNRQQQMIFDKFTAAILTQSRTAPGTFLTLEGSGGCGKTELAKQIMAFVRSTPCGPSAKPKTVHAVCSTALGAQNYPQGECSTAHSFFCLPVEEEYDKEVDDYEGMQCNAKTKPERYELIKAADVILWDEAMANHRECLEAVMHEFDNFRGKVLILMYDAKQMLPVVPGGDHIEIVKACLFSSPHWSKFQRHLLIENMRLQHIADPEEQAHQIAYDRMIRGVGENVAVPDLVIRDGDEDPDGVDESPNCKRFTLTAIPKENIFNGDIGTDPFEPALQWLYPNGYSPQHAAKNVVLATTNAAVDEWNERIAALNTASENKTLLSTDTFTDVDDTHGYLQQMITDEVLEKYNTNDVPPHKLVLKVGDVCLIMRNLNVNDGVTNNTRVVILQISTRYVYCQTLSARPVPVCLPRIRFNFRLPYGQSFTMTRLQFPLRRAFALSVHKSQGQTLERALMDARQDFFAHGHLYVGMSRVTRYDNIAFFLSHYQLHCDPSPSLRNSCIMHNRPLLWNIVYPEAISEIQVLTQAYEAENSAGLP